MPDKLVLCQVDIGEVNALQIVCGAPNVCEGMFAPVATIGTELPTGITIKHAKLRGEESHGMLCSEKELDISDEAAGLMELSLRPIYRHTAYRSVRFRRCDI